MNYSKITLLVLTLFCYTLQGMQQEVTPVAQIFTEMQTTINDPSKYDFDTIQDTHEGAKLIQEISPLTLDEKNALLQKTYDTLLQADITYPKLRLLAKLLVLSGADANLNLGRTSNHDLFQESLLEEDQKMVDFLLKHHTDTTKIYDSGPLLDLAKTYPMAFLLVEHDALKPYAFNASLQRELLEKNFFRPEYDYRLATLYKRELKKQYNVDLNFAGADQYKWTLLHLLCSSCSIKKHDFFEKLRILLGEKAVDLQSRNNDNKRPIDIINERLKNSPNQPGLLFAQRLLTDLKNNPLEFNVLTRKNQEKRAK